MSDETRFNPLGNFDPFAETEETRLTDTQATECSETAISENALNAEQPQGAKGSKIGWKAYTITGIGAIALTGGALAGVGAFDATATPAAAKATPKAAATGSEDSSENTAEAAADTTDAATQDEADYAAENAVANGKNADESTDYTISSSPSAATAATDTAGANAQSAPAPDFDHTQYSPVVIEYSDDFSFADAFASAREFCGVGGTFIWHGQVYSTYYREEWDAMTPAEKDSYLAAANSNYIEHRNEFGEFSADHYADNTLESYDDDAFGPDTYDNSMAYTGPAAETGDDVAMTLGDVRTYEFDDSEMTIGEATIDGHQAVFIDVDNDGVFDVVGIDVNDNNDLDENELINIEDQQLTIGDFQAAAEDLNPMAYNAGLDDFTNDADVSDFA